MKKCSKCRKDKPLDNFGFKKNGTEYKTCATCRANACKNKNNTCHFLCVNPSKGLHHCKCPNFVPPSPDLQHVFALNRAAGEREAEREAERNAKNQNANKFAWKKGFLNTTENRRKEMPKQVIRENSCTFDEICLTLKQYGYSIYTKDDVYLMHFNFLDFLEMKHKLKHTKSIFIYQLSYPVKADEIEFCQEVLGLDDFLGNPEPILICLLSNEKGKIVGSYLPYVNVFENYVHTTKIKNNRRCNTDY